MIRNKSKIIFLIFLIILLNSCKKTFDTKEEYLDYLKEENNGYSETKLVNGIKVNVSYKPTRFMALQEDPHESEAKKDSLNSKYGKFIYFILSYNREDKEILSTINESREKYNFIQNTLTFDMDRYVSLTTESRDTIPLVGFNFPRTYGMSHSTNLLFVFDRNKLTQEQGDLFFNLKDIGLETGDLKFKFNVKNIKE